jgi:hypothetical protein
MYVRAASCDIHAEVTLVYRGTLPEQRKGRHDNLEAICRLLTLLLIPNIPSRPQKTFDLRDS